MAPIESLGPVFVAASLVVAAYFAYRLRNMIRNPEPTVETTTDIYTESLTAKALNELSKPQPNFAPIVKIMETEIRHSGKWGTVLGQRFLKECKELDLNRRVDAGTFGRLYYSYLDVIEIARR